MYICRTFKRSFLMFVDEKCPFFWIQLLERHHKVDIQLSAYTHTHTHTHTTHHSTLVSSYCPAHPTRPTGIDHFPRPVCVSPWCCVVSLSYTRWPQCFIHVSAARSSTRSRQQGCHHYLLLLFVCSAYFQPTFKWHQLAGGLTTALATLNTRSFGF